MKYICSYSGGKDSTVMLLEIIKRKLPLDYIVFCDTCFEFPEMYEYIDKIETFVDKKIIRLKSNRNYEEWFCGKIKRGEREGRLRGFPYSCSPCYWMRESKQKPMEDFIKKIGKCKIYLGYTIDEKNRIQKDNKYIYPLINFNLSEKNCFDYLEEINMLNPLYNKFDRTWCFWCPKQPLKSLKIVCKDYPEQWQWIKEHEKLSPHGYKPNFNCEEFERKVLDQTTLDRFE